MERKNKLSEQAKAHIRVMREKECFAYTDRAAWYDTLSISQKREVLKWRKKWLDATETGICPEKPLWIK